MNRYVIKQGLWGFEIIDTKTNTMVGCQETYPNAKKVLNRIKKGKNE